MAGQWLSRDPRHRGEGAKEDKAGFSHVPRPRMRKVAAMLKAIHAAEHVQAARDKARQVVVKLRDGRLTRAAELVDCGIEETFGYYAFPEEHWRRTRTNNLLERLLREIRRRTSGRIVPGWAIGAEPGRGSLATRCRHEWSTKRCLSMDRLNGRQMSAATPEPEPDVTQPRPKVRKKVDSTRSFPSICPAADSL